MAIQANLFDLDGTLETNQLIIDSFLHTLNGITSQPLTRDDIAGHMGRPLIEQLRFFTDKQNVGQLAEIYMITDMRDLLQLVGMAEDAK